MTTFALLNEPGCLDLGRFALPPPEEAPGLDATSSGWEGLRSGRGTATFRTRAVRECLDTVAVLRAYREPLPGEVWSLPWASERRLLSQVNVILAFGRESLGQVVDLAIDPDLPDPGRVFAALFVLGCVAGPAWLQPTVRIFVTAVERCPAERAAAVEALSLTQNGEVLEQVTELLTHERANVRAAAVRVLSFRSGLRQSQWTRAIEDDDAAVAQAAVCAPVIDRDLEGCRRALEHLLHHRSEGVVRSALRAGLTLRLEVAHFRAREMSRKSPEWADALHFLAMFGLASDEDTLRTALTGAQWLSGVRAVALSGRGGLIPDLVALAPPGDVTPAQRAEIALALTTITDLPFAAAADAAAAATLWSQNQHRFDAGQRYRHGRRFHPSVLLDGLRLRALAVDDSRLHARASRERAYFELVAAAGGGIPRFSAYDFVACQVRSLQHIESWLAGSVDPHWVATPLH